MNIFATDKCPVKSAKFLDDKRLIKMVLESAQLLSGAINECGGKATYKTTHKNHPASVWTRQSRSNYRWLLKHFIALCREYTRRRGKIHKCQGLIMELYKNVHIIPENGFTGFVNCAANKTHNLNYKHLTDVNKAYQIYLSKRFMKDTKPPFCSLSGTTTLVYGKEDK